MINISRNLTPFLLLVMSLYQQSTVIIVPNGKAFFVKYGLLSLTPVDCLYRESYLTDPHFPHILHQSNVNFFFFFSVQFSRSDESNSLQPHESQHARPLCPSPTPGVY